MKVARAILGAASAKLGRRLITPATAWVKGSYFNDLGAATRVME